MLIDKFFIIGLPRSRTYWLSQFFGCLHEGVYHYPDYRDFLKSDHTGDSTTCYLQIKDLIKDERKVIIHRDIKDVGDSLVELFGKFDCSFLKDIEKELLEEDGLHVQFDDISSRLEEIWDYCRSDEFPKEKALKMDDVIMENHFLIGEVKKLVIL